MLGASARYGTTQLIGVEPGRFPWPTFLQNVSGSLLLGLLLVVVLERFPPSRYVRPFLASGLLASFTTMSTFAVETALLLKDGHVTTGVVYAVVSIAAGLLAAYAGTRTGRLIPTRHTEAHG